MTGSGCSSSGSVPLFCSVLSLRPGHIALSLKPQVFSLISFLISQPQLTQRHVSDINDYYFKPVSVEDGLLPSNIYLSNTITSLRGLNDSPYKIFSTMLGI